MQRLSICCQAVRRGVVAAVGVLIVASAGCIGSATVPMSGVVTFDGQPLSGGTLTLTPLDQTTAPSTGSAVENGRYEITAQKGLRKGVTYRVEISAMNVPPGFTLKPGEYPTFQDKIPAAYNRESKLTVAVSADASSVEQNFSLSSSGQAVK